MNPEKIIAAAVVKWYGPNYARTTEGIGKFITDELRSHGLFIDKAWVPD